MKRRLSLLLFLAILLTACAAAPSETATARPTETPTPEPATAVPLNVSPDVKAVLDTQKAQYEVNVQGQAVIDLKDTATTQEKIVLTEISNTKTNDGIAKNIVSGYDKDDNRIVFVEGYGWIKKPATGSFDARTVVEYNVPNSVLNTFAALDYSENPTINTDRIPTFWLTLRGIPGYKPGAELGFYPTINWMDYTKKEDIFSAKDKPFTWSGVYQRGDVVKVIMTVNSGTEANPTKTNLILTMSVTDYNKQMSTTPGRDVFLKNTREVMGMLESGPEFTGRVFAAAAWSNLVPNPDDQGKIIALLPKEMQDRIKAGFEYLSTTPNNQATDLNKQIIKLDGGLPPQISLIDIPVVNIENWPQGPLETFNK